MIKNRDERLMYLLTGEDYNLIGQGVTSARTSPNAQTSSSQFIHQRNAAGGLSGYAPATAFTSQLDDEDPVSLFVQNIADNYLIGSDAATKLVELDTWKTTGSNARLREGIISIDDPGSGDAGNPLDLNWTFTDQKDPVEGVFAKNETTHKWEFTPA